MNINIQEFLKEAEITEAFYPGKRLVKSCRQAGEYKSHCVVLDWRRPDVIRIEVKAGLSGRDLEPKRLKYYPVSLQSPTYVDIEIVNDNVEEEDKSEEEEDGKASGKSGSGGKKPKKAKKKISISALEAFGEARDSKAPSLGKIVEMVVLGTEIAAEAFGQVMGTLAKQIAKTKITATDLLARGTDMVTRYTPPGFMKPKGDETAEYKYNREINEDIGYRRPAAG